MKRLLLIVAAMFGFLFQGCGQSAPKFVEGTPEKYLYTYSGMVAHPLEWYCVERTGDGALHLLYSAGGPEISVYNAPEDVFERIGELVRQHKLYKLESSYRPSMEILDGYGWTISIDYKDGGIWSGGSNAWPPQDLSGGIAAINGYLKRLIDSAEPIGKEYHYTRRE